MAADAAPPANSLADQAFAAAAAAYARSSGDWELAVRSAIAALFAFLAERPAATAACVADCARGPEALAHRDRTIGRFVALLQPGLEAPGAPSTAVAEAIGGGIFEIVRGHAVERRLGELPAATPHATIVALSPFVGPDAAAELAGTTNDAR